MIPCPSCGTENPAGVKFCPECGAALVSRAAPSRDVRKLVTILFTDVAGSTALGEELDPETLRSVMDGYFTIIRGIIEQHGGTVEKFIGDAVMAVFGIPVLHEDDALRAVRAADAIRSDLAALDAAAAIGPRLTFRTGINTGEVFARDPSGGQAFVTGDPVNTAARLEQGAGPGEILLGESTYKLVRDAVVVEAIEAISAKGKAEPLPAYRLVAVGTEREGHIRRLDAPLVGRDRELDRLGGAFRATDRGTLVPSVHAAGAGGDRQEPARRRIHGRGRAPGDRPARPLSQLWRGDHLLADRRDRPDRGRHRRCRWVGRCPTQAVRPVSRANAIATRWRRGSPMRSACRSTRRPRKRSSGPSGSCSSTWRASDRSWSSSRTSTGPNRHCSISSSTSPSGVTMPRSCCSARRDPNCSTTRAGWATGTMNATTILLEPLGSEATTQLIGELPGGTAVADDHRRPDPGRRRGQSAVRRRDAPHARR